MATSRSPSRSPRRLHVHAPRLVDVALIANMTSAATRIQAAWRGIKTRALVNRYISLMMVRGFTTANPSLHKFVVRTPLNMGGTMRRSTMRSLLDDLADTDGEED